MTDTLKVLGQQNPSAATLTTIYTAPASTQAVISKLTICNRSATPTTFRVAIRPAGAAISNEHYTHYDVPIGANEPWEGLAGLSLGATDVVSVYATLATLSFNLFGVERA